MRLHLLASSAALICLPTLAAAAMLKPYSAITSPIVRLSDIFGDLGSVPDRDLGRAPAPGERILVAAPQLAAIARDFNVDWRPATGTEHAVIERRRDSLPGSVILDALRQALEAAGAPSGSDISTPDVQPIAIPVGSKPIPEVSQCNYEPAGGRFTALVSVTPPDMPTIQMRISGTVIALARATVPTHHLARGAVLAAADIRIVLVRLSLLHGHAAVQTDNIIGMVLKHDVASGQPLTPLDVARPDLVQRGSLVRMTLRSDGIALAAEGIAKEGGAEGDKIHVENPTSHAIVEAEIIGPDAVRVEPRRAGITLVAAQ